jgi:hypothetical protein
MEGDRKMQIKFKAGGDEVSVPFAEGVSLRSRLSTVADLLGIDLSHVTLAVATGATVDLDLPPAASEYVFVPQAGTKGL